MIRTINKDIETLKLKAEPATPDDIVIADDLLETLQAHADACVGMAANMIGINKAIIVFNCQGKLMEMFNPVIISSSGSYDTEEGCLSLEGQRKTKRYHYIKVRYQDRQFISHVKRFSGWEAQIIQHEIDHCNGIII
jgi:peptide deformylase